VRALRLLAQDLVEECAVVVTLDRALVDTQQAFDGVAAAYDRTNAGNPTLCAMRERVRAVAGALLAPGAHLLDLGCGPGTDAHHFGARGYRVTAIDWSPAMVDQARRRVRIAGLAGRVDVQHVAIHDLARVAPADAQFDAAISNFGPLNCVVDPDGAARLIASRLRPGGVLIASVIGRVCPWEIAVHLARGQASRAFVRFRRGFVPVPLEGRTVWTRYYTPSEFARIFAAAGLAPISLRALGVLVPPPYLQAFAARHPGLVAALQRAEDRAASWPLVRQCGDHFLIVMRKRA
jgi:SAM-dependent methyltransferase